MWKLWPRSFPRWATRSGYWRRTTPMTAWHVTHRGARPQERPLPDHVVPLGRTIGFR